MLTEAQKQRLENLGLTEETPCCWGPKHEKPRGVTMWTHADEITVVYLDTMKLHFPPKYTDKAIDHAEHLINAHKIAKEYSNSDVSFNVLELIKL